MSADDLLPVSSWFCMAVGVWLAITSGRRHRDDDSIQAGKARWYQKASCPASPPPPAPPTITEGRCLANMKCVYYREMPKGPPPPLRPVPPANLRIKSGVIPTAEEVLNRQPPETK